MKTISVPIALNQMSETGRGMATLLHDLGADSLISNILMLKHDLEKVMPLRPHVVASSSTRMSW